jgi:L-lactate dehydrogenase complex protein LldG
MNSRDAVLSRIRSLLDGQSSPPLPPTPEVWPDTQPSAEQMAAQFAEELSAVHGETIRCRTIDEARRTLTDLAAGEKWTSIGALDRPLCRRAAEGLSPQQVVWESPDWNPQQMASLDAGLLEADYLLADTGSAMVACGRPEQRVLTYIPPACVIVATADRLREHLPSAWREIEPRAADPALRGEFVLVTGPSRTADIEKILILGVHGPKRLVVLLVDES